LLLQSIISARSNRWRVNKDLSEHCWIKFADVLKLFVFHKIIFKVSPYYQVHIYRGNQCYSTVVIINWSSAKKHSFLQWQWKCPLLYITIRFTVTIYPYLKWQWILYFLRRYFSFLYHRIALSMDYQWLLCFSPCCVFSHDWFVYGLSMFDFPFTFFCVVILLCLSPCCVLSHDYFVYGLSMFDFPFTFSVLLFCFVCLPALSCPTIALSIDHQCLISPSFFSVLLFSFVCPPAVSYPTIALSMDYQYLISPSLFLCCYFALFVSLLCLVPRLPCLWIINVWFPLHLCLAIIYM
jgi:hypothetical protein